VDWLLSVQRDDGGWGEDEETYRSAPPGRYKESLPSQTAWAVLGLMARGEANHPAVARGIAYLTRDPPAGRRVDRTAVQRRWIFHACSTCVTMATGCTSRCSPWPATGTFETRTANGSRPGSELRRRPMALLAFPAVFMRGGTSRAIMFHAKVSAAARGMGIRFSLPRWQSGSERPAIERHGRRDFLVVEGLCAGAV